MALSDRVQTTQLLFHFAIIREFYLYPPQIGNLVGSSDPLELVQNIGGRVLAIKIFVCGLKNIHMLLSSRRQ